MLAEIALYKGQFVQLAAQYLEVAPRPPKPWTIPRIFGRTWRENFISDYLAYLLNPAKSGLGTAPLAALLELCDIDLSSIDLAGVLIHREYNLDGRRIDLLLEWEDELVVGIEAKIGATENPGQTKHYARVISREFKGVPQHCIFLTRTGTKAKSTKFQPLSWTQLLEAFRAVEIDEVDHLRQRILWEDFLEHLEVFIVMSDPNQFQFSEKAALYLEYGSMIEDVRKAFNAEWADAIAFLENHLNANLSGGPWETNFNRTRHHWHQVYKTHWKTGGVFVHYQYDIPPSLLSEGKFNFFVDVEGSQPELFLTRFNHHYLEFKDLYHQFGISYRPATRRKSIAAKTYGTDKTIEAVAHTFMEAFTEFRFLETGIDDVLSDLKESMGDV